MKNIARILVPIDFSPHSTAALSFAADLARRYEASLHLLHVFKVIIYALPDGYTAPSADQIEILSAEAAKLLETAKHDALATGVQHVETTLLHGDPVAAIERFARDGKFDLIVMGTHGRTGAKHLLIGSVAEKTVRRAPCPVLTVRTAASTAAAAAAPAV
jgi:nucleotide-binding universal stress UspA family protein